MFANSEYISKSREALESYTGGGGEAAVGVGDSFPCLP